METEIQTRDGKKTHKKGEVEIEETEAEKEELLQFVFVTRVEKIWKNKPLFKIRVREILQYYDFNVCL